GNAPDLEDGFQGFSQYQLIAFGQRLAHRPTDRSGNQLQIFTKAIIQRPLDRPHPYVYGNATEQQQRHHNTEHQRNCSDRNSAPTRYPNNAITTTLQKCHSLSATCGNLPQGRLLSFNHTEYTTYCFL